MVIDFLTRRKILFATGFATLLGASCLLAAERGPAPALTSLPRQGNELDAPVSSAEVSGGVTAPSANGLPLPLGRTFDRQSAGITFQYPAGFKAIVRPESTELICFVDDEKKPGWILSAERRSFADFQKLFGVTNARGEKPPGIVENTLAALKEQFPGAKVLRAGDPTNVGKFNVGVLILRYTVNGERRLAQHAIIQVSNRLFYLVSLITPGRRDVTEDKNAEEVTVAPIEASADRTFRSILDSISIHDLSPIRQEQDDRVLTFRGVETNLTAERIKPLLIPERYQRILKDGVDVGYSYIVETSERRGLQEGIQVGIRTRLMSKVANGKALPFPREDNEAFMFATMDQNVEEWSKVTVFDDDGKPHGPDNPWRKVSEIGTSKMEQKRTLQVNPNDPTKPQNRVRQGEEGDPHQPWVDIVKNHKLTVTSRAGRSDLPAVERDLPTFYLPQALDVLLPRLIYVDQPKKFALGTYVSELREVMMRYIDVGREASELPKEIRDATGETTAVPVADRLGYEGERTIHYITKKGRYLGSYTPATKVAIVPTDLQTLLSIWKVKDNFALFQLPADLQPADQMKKVSPANARPPGAPAMPKTGDASPLPKQLGQP